MLKLENTEVVGWGHAIRGMRNPKNSWEKRDSGYCQEDFLRDCTTCILNDNCWRGGFDIGPNDHSLMMTLRNAGTDHRKYMRMITVYTDITAPLYWWKEFDTYKVGTVANSCSTMHKIADKEFTLEDFSCEHLTEQSITLLEDIVNLLNMYRVLYISKTDQRVDSYTIMSDECYTKYKKDIWWQMIQLLPTSYNQKQTVMLNYEVLANIYKSRRHHKLDEWHTLCDWVKKLPYSELITGEEK